MDASGYDTQHSGAVILYALDLSFSCWFFYLFWKAQRILFSAIGTKAMASVTSHNIAFLNQQTFGAVMGIAVISLWLSRHHFKKLVKSLFEGRSRSYDSDEPMKYGNAILGLIAGGAFLFFFSWSAGMAPWVAVAFFIFYYAFALTIAKLRAELGTPVHDFHATGPDQIMAEALGTRTLGTRSLTIFSLYHFFNRTYRSHPMPHPAEGFKIASQTGMDPKRLFRAMVVALFIGVPVFFWVYLHVSYKYQGSMVMRFAAWSYRRLESQLVYPHTFDPYSRCVYCCWLRNNSRPDVPSHEVYLVDPSSCWVCHIQQFLDERLLVLHFYELAVEVHDIALRRIQNS